VFKKAPFRVVITLVKQAQGQFRAVISVVKTKQFRVVIGVVKK